MKTANIILNTAKGYGLRMGGLLSLNSIAKIGLSLRSQRFSLISIIILFGCIGFVQAATINSTATGGNWNVASTWATGTVPATTDAVVIVSGATVTIAATTTCTGITVNSGGTLRIGAFVLTVNGDVVINGVWNETAAANHVFAGNFTNNATSFTASTGSHTFSGATKTIGGTSTVTIPTVIFTGTYTNSGTLTVATALSGSGGLTQGATGVLNIGGSSGITTLTATAAGNTVNYTGGGQTLKVTPYYNLTLSGVGAETFGAITTVAGNLTFIGTASAVAGANLAIGGNLSLGNGTAFTIGAFTLGVTGTTTVGGGASGTLTISSATGTKTFGGAVTINTGAAITESAAATLAFGSDVTINGTLTESGAALVGFAGNVTNNGTYTASTGVHTFSGTAKIISGTAIISIPNVTISGSYTNSGTFTITSALAGTGGLTNTGTLNLNFTGSPTITSFNASTTGNVVNYGYAGTQTIYSTNYYNLSTSGSGAKTLPAASINILGNLTVGAGTTLTYDAALARIINVSGNVNGSGTINMMGALAHQFNISGVASTYSGNFNTTNASGSSVTFNAAGAQTVFGSGTGYFQNLNIQGGGAKALQSAAVVNGVLTLTSGVLQLGNYNLTIANANAIVGSFGYANMIETNGTGFLIRSASATNASFNGTYPVGNGAYYEPVIISGLTGAVAAARSLYVRSVPTNPAVFGNGINKYWDMTGTTGITVGTGMISFQYNAADATGDQTILQLYNNTSGSWQLATGASAAGVNPMTSTGTASFAGLWSAGSVSTYYSYQSGDWNTALTWTTDPSGTLSENPGVPGVFDNVVILNGRTIGVSANTKIVSSLEIRLGGYLDLASTTGHNFGTVTGQGVLKLSSSSFPLGTYTSFVAAGGGTIEYDNSSNFTLSSAQPIYNNLIINCSSTAVTGNVVMSNLTINGTFTVQKGTFMIGQDAAYAGDGRVVINFKNDVIVSANGAITVGLASTNNTNLPATFTGKPFSTGTSIPPSGYETGVLVPRYYDIYHKVYIGGNLVNNGTVKFISSAITIPNFTTLTTSGAATVRFYGLNNASLTCNGQTDLYNLIVDKGSDQTYILTIDAAATSNFRLFGRNDWGGGGGTDASNPELDKALWIKNGTLRLTGSVTIPSLSEGSCSGGTPNSDFYIPLNGALLIDGPNVTVLSTADSYLEVNAAYGLSQASNTYNVNTGAGCSSFSIYGKFQMNSGFMSTRESGGFIFWSDANGVFVLNGGFIDAKQLRSAGGVSGVASFIQNGGTLQLRGRYAINGTGISTVAQIRNAPVDYGTISTGGLNGAFGTFNINNANNLFTMTGSGVMNILDVCQDNGYAFEVRSNAQNNTVTGGTVNINTYNNTNYYIYTNSAIQNLNITRLSGTATVLQSSAMTINNTLNLTANSILNAQNNDLTVGGNFTLNTGCTYTPGTNNTILNGLGGQVFTNAGTITSGLNNFILSNTSNTNITNNLTVLGGLTINSACFLNDQGNAINVAGNIVNSGTHTSQANGAIILNGTLAQTIGGNGSGVFGNLVLNKTAGTTTFTIDQMVNGNIRLASGILDINRYKLTLSSTSNIYDALTGTTAVFGNAKMINLLGLVSDGGIAKPYTAIGSFVFPIGNAAGYRPATIGFSQAPTTWGSVNVKLAARVHPLATSTNALKYYWKVVSTGFTGIPANSVSHVYHFINPGDINAGTLAAYIPGSYNPYAWTVINDVSQVDKINYNVKFTNVSYLDGEYTAGQTDALGVVGIFYSRKTTGNWNDADMWSTDPVLKWGGAACNCVPSTDDVVLIGDGATYNHTVSITASGKTVGSLTINSGSVLDIGTTTGHNFGSSPDQKITGSGTLRISSAVATAVFPGGDFGNFLNTGGGTVEYYSVAASPATITLPTSYTVGAVVVNITNYNNLVLTPLAAKNIILPNTDLTVLGNLTTQGTGLSEFNTLATTHTVRVNGNVNVVAGTLEFMNGNNTAQNMIVNGNVTVSSGATFDVANANTATNTMTIQGNLVNAGTFNMYIAAGRVCDVTFTGALNNVISGLGTSRFDILTVNKGTDRNSVLDVTSTAFSLNTTLATALNLINGTFRFSGGPAITLTTTGAFTVPSTACLSANGGTINIGQSNTTGADLFLLGRLEVLGGAVNIGLTTGATSDNDIEYASAGNPEIIVSGGTLIVNGQIRRNTSNTLGSLWYTQSGGSVTIRGIANNVTRGMFEVTNDGSQFNMSGGTMNIERSGSTTYADAYIVPASNSVTGGIIQFGNTNTPAGNASFTLNSSSPLGSVLVDGTTISKTVTLAVNPLVLVNDLTINGAASVFNCNSLNVSIGRNFSNNNTIGTVGIAFGGYQPGSSTQNTTFNGSTAESIAGVAGNLTNFANLLVSSSSTLTLSSGSNLAVNNNLTLNSGTLADGGNTITVYGNIVNNATHTSSAGNGVVLNGTQKQIISGSGYGVFGNVNINNTNGVNLVDNTVINGALTLSNGVFYIDDYKLTLGTSASVTSGSAFGITRMITLNGVISDQGVTKMFSGSTAAFTFPIGVAGKYTPAVYTITSSTAGSVRVIPVDQTNPSEVNPVGDELAYYWKAVTTGFGGLTAATQTYSYVTSDVAGVESQYHGARYNGGVWTDFGTAAMNTSSVPHSINFSGSFLDGEYTAGVIANFGIVHPLYSLKSGNWSDPTVWAQDSPSNLTCNCYPSGNPVYIQDGHTITMDMSNSYAYSVDIPTNAVLDMSDKLYSSLGFITGTGKIKLKGTTSGSYVFPGGNYDAFMTDATGQSRVEFYGTIPATLPLKPGNVYKPYQNVILTDAGAKYMSAENMKVFKNLTINNGASLNNTLQNKNIYILGNWIDNNTVTSGFVPGAGLVSFEGSTAQQLTVLNNLTENFYDFRINNAAGLSLVAGGGLGDVLVSDYLYLTNGVMNASTSNSITVANTSPSAVVGGSTTSFVDGPLYKAINSGSYFTFPVGNSGRYGNVYLSNISVAGTWTAQYFNAAPTYNVNSKLTPIDQVSNNEYWWVSGPAAGQGNVRLRWDASSGFVSSTAASRSKIRAIEWNPTLSQWEYRGKVLADGGTTSGTVQTDNIISLALGTNLHYLTLGMESLPTATITSTLTPSICNDGVGSTSISIALTGTAPWSLSYKLGSVTSSLTNIASSPATIVLTSASAGISGPGTYNFNVTNINDAVGIPGVKDYVTTAVVTVKPVPAPSLVSPRTSVGTNEVVVYTAALVAGDTYTWSVTNGTIQASSGNTVTIKWSGTVGTGSVSVTETNPTYSCPITILQAVTIVNAPVPNVTGNINPCSGAVERYQTPFVTGHTYVWSVVGGTGVAVAGNTNMYDVTWGAAGAGSVTVSESSGSTVANTLTVTVNPIPSVANTVNAPAICNGQDAVITVNSADGSGTDYQLRIGTTVVSGALYHNTVAGATITLTATPGPSANTTYNILATNQFSCSAQLTNTASVVVNPVPAITTNPVDRTICEGANTTFGIVATGATGYQWQVNLGSGWNNLANTAPYTGATSGTLNITGATIAMSSYQYRCVASNAFTCSATSSLGTLTVKPTVTIDAFTPASSTRCQGAGSVTTTTTATNFTSITYALDAASLTGGNTVNAATGAVTYAAGWSGTTTITASAAGCNGPVTTTHVVTITPTVAINAFSPATSTLCQGSGTVTTTTTATNFTSLTYSLDAASVTGGNTINAATGAVTYAAGWSGITTISASATGCNGPVTTTSVVTITPLPASGPIYREPNN